MKKQIFIAFTSGLNLGGIETSLISLLDCIDYDKYDVDLFLYSHHGELHNLINKNVNILPEYRELSYLGDTIKEKIKHGAFYSAFIRLVDKPINDSWHYSWEKVLKFVNPKFKKEYDVALGFFLPFNVIKEYVNAKVKIGWIHTDYSVEKKQGDYLLYNYSGLDYIAAVSEGSKRAFDSIVPELSNKTFVLENCLSKNMIISKSKEPFETFEYDSDSIKLLSIGRYCKAKNFDNIPEILTKIRNAGINAKWYIIGFGIESEYTLIKNKITEYHMEDYVILLGKKSNPYPYIKNCDIYIQPSRYEGRSVAVIEAQMLNKPVIITKYNTSSGQLVDGFDGIIVPMDNEGCANGIVDVINNKDLQNTLIENTKKVDYSNSSELEKLYKLF